MEAFLCGSGDAVLPIAVKDLGNGCYVLSSTADKPGTWTIKPRVSCIYTHVDVGMAVRGGSSSSCKLAAVVMAWALTVIHCCHCQCAMILFVGHADLSLLWRVRSASWRPCTGQSPQQTAC